MDKMGKCIIMCSMSMVYSRHHINANLMGKLTPIKKFVSSSKGDIIFFRRGVPNLQKVSINKIVTPHYFSNKNFMTPLHRYTLPPKQAKIVLKLVFLNKINILSMVILWLPTFWSSKILWPPYFSFQKCMTPQYVWDPHTRKKMIASRDIVEFLQECLGPGSFDI